jgi:catechol 2,3-dioxygenase-like lactoylglutathione lyase family enzyme
MESRSIDAGTSITGVSHVGWTVSDVESQAAFYGALFGCAPEVRGVYDRPYTAAQVGYEGARLDIAIFRVPGSEVRLELIQYLHPVGDPVDIETRNPGTGHLCLTTDDIERVIARATNLGATARSDGPVTITAGPNVGRRVCYLRDPEGITIELLEPHRRPQPTVPVTAGRS